MGNESSSHRKSARSRKKRNSPRDMDMSIGATEPISGATTSSSPRRSNEDRGKPTPPAMQTSVESFDRAPYPNKPKNNDNNNWDPGMITSGITNVKERYHINPQEVGHGHYGVVRKCMDRETKEWYAIKSIRKSKVNKVEVLKREIQILKEVNHPNIIRLIEVHEDEKYLHLITELCTGGELFDRIIAKTQSPEGHFSERDAANLIRSILDAIAYCHDELQIVHRDLKPENFLFASHAENAPIKIIDFGLSRHESNPGLMMKTKVGTPYYVAPEVLKRKYTKSCDIWSIGVITYILLCGYPPFYGDDDAQIFDSVRAGKFDFPSPEWDSISSAAKDFICCLLKKEPEDRLTARQAMNHKWIQTFITPRRSSLVRTNRRRSLIYQNYIAMQKLKKAILGYIVTNLTPAEIGNLEDLFRRIDKNGDGHMTLEDLDEALGSGKFSFDSDLKHKLQDLRDDLCLSGEERINWKEFLATMIDKSLLIKEDKIKLAFDHFRNADDNCLKVEELVKMLGGESSAREIFHLDKIDGNDTITYDQFKTYLTTSFESDNIEELALAI